MKINKIISFVSALFILSFSQISCNSSDDDSGATYESSFTYKHNGVEQPVKDYYAYLNADSQLVISAFSAKLPVEGIEDQVEDIYTKRNLIIGLSKFEEGRYDIESIEAALQLDTLFYSYSSTPYKVSSLTPDLDSLDNVNSFVYIKDIKNGHDLVSGNFRIHRMSIDSANVPYILYSLEGDFQHVPFTKYN